MREIDTGCDLLFRHRRNTHDAVISFDIFIMGIDNPSQTAADMYSNATSQIDELRDFVQSLMDTGGLDIDGLQLVVNSLVSADGAAFMVCQAGELEDYTSYTCSR